MQMLEQTVSWEQLAGICNQEHKSMLVRRPWVLYDDLFPVTVASSGATVLILPYEVEGSDGEMLPEKLEQRMLKYVQGKAVAKRKFRCRDLLEWLNSVKPVKQIDSEDWRRWGTIGNHLVDVDDLEKVLNLVIDESQSGHISFNAPLGYDSVLIQTPYWRVWVASRERLSKTFLESHTYIKCFLRG